MGQGGLLMFMKTLTPPFDVMQACCESLGVGEWQRESTTGSIFLDQFRQRDNICDGRRQAGGGNTALLGDSASQVSLGRQRDVLGRLLILGVSVRVWFSLLEEKFTSL